MKKSKIPNELKHDWQPMKRDNPLAETLTSLKHTYFCEPCGSWTSNLPLYRNEVCAQKDRRKTKTERRQLKSTVEF